MFQRLASTAQPGPGIAPLLAAGLMFATLALVALAGETIATEPEAAHAADAKPADAKSAEHDATVELRDIAQHAFEETIGFYESGDAFAEEVYRWSRTWLDHDLTLAADDQQKIIGTEAHLDRMHDLANAGLWRARELEYFVAEAEEMLNRVKPNPHFAATIAARKALQGQWDVVSIEEDGGASPKPDIRSITIVGRRATFEHRLGTARATLILDVATKPAGIDIIGLNEDFPFGGQGIYKLDGDTLTLCWGAGAVRPADFTTKAGDNTTLCVLKRAGAK